MIWTVLNVVVTLVGASMVLVLVAYWREFVIESRPKLWKVVWTDAQLSELGISAVVFRGMSLRGVRFPRTCTRQEAQTWLRRRGYSVIRSYDRRLS